MTKTEMLLGGPGLIQFSSASTGSKPTMIQANDIPRFTNGKWTDTVELPDGYSVRVSVEYDECLGEPWKEHGGHGPVSEWRPLDSKSAGERLLCVDRRRALFYDFAEACKIARRDGWGYPGQYIFEDGKKPRLTEDARKLTPKQRAARAAEADFERLRAWCNGDWYWITVGVEVSRNGAVLDTDCCGGIESDGDYWREHAAEQARYIIAADQKKRAAAWRAALKEARERHYWINRGVLTEAA